MRHDIYIAGYEAGYDGCELHEAPPKRDLQYTDLWDPETLIVHLAKSCAGKFFDLEGMGDYEVRKFTIATEKVDCVHRELMGAPTCRDDAINTDTRI